MRVHVSGCDQISELPFTWPIFEIFGHPFEKSVISYQSRLFKIKPTSSISHETALVQVKLIPYKKFLKILNPKLDDISGFWSRSG